jgi:hypothetical protein
MAVDPRVTTTQWVGAIVGKFVVGDGTVVGPPRFQPAKPKLTLKGKPFQTFVAGDLKQVNPAKGRMVLGLVDINHPAIEYSVNVSSTVAPSAGAGPLLILRGKAGLRLVTPGRQVTGKPRLTLRGKHINRVTSITVQPGKAKLSLTGGTLGRVGKAGLTPSPPIDRPLLPSPAQEELLVVTPAYTDGLLVPTVERSA